MVELNKRKIISELNSSVEKCVASFGKKIDAVYVFGSFTNEKFNSLSDVDICFLGKFSFKEKAKIVSFFGELFDVSFFNDLPVYIKIRVFREGKRIYSSDIKKVYAYLFNTIREYEDFLPIIKSRVGVSNVS